MKKATVFIVLSLVLVGCGGAVTKPLASPICESVDDPIYLPLVMKNYEYRCQDGLTNGDFEQGSTIGWIKDSLQGRELIFYGVGFGASWGAKMGPVPPARDENQTLQQIGLHGDIRYLSFRLASEANTGDPADGYLRVWIAQEGTVLWGSEVFNPGDRAWFEYAYDLGTLRVQDAELVFYYRGIRVSEGLLSTYYLDDVYLEICR